MSSSNNGGARNSRGRYLDKSRSASSSASLPSSSSSSSSSCSWSVALRWVLLLGWFAIMVGLLLAWYLDDPEVSLLGASLGERGCPPSSYHASGQSACTAGGSIACRLSDDDSSTTEASAAADEPLQCVVLHLVRRWYAWPIAAAVTAVVLCLQCHQVRQRRKKAWFDRTTSVAYQISDRCITNSKMPVTVGYLRNHLSHYLDSHCQPEEKILVWQACQKKLAEGERFTKVHIMQADGALQQGWVKRIIYAK